MQGNFLKKQICFQEKVDINMLYKMANFFAKKPQKLTKCREKLLLLYGKRYVPTICSKYLLFSYKIWGFQPAQITEFLLKHSYSNWANISFALDNLWQLDLFWHPMMFKMLFHTFWKFALDDLWWPWPDSDLPLCLKYLFCA